MGILGKLSAWIFSQRTEYKSTNQLICIIGWLEALAMESRSYGSQRTRGRGKSNFGSRDYRMEGRRDQNSSRGGGGGGRFGNGGNAGGKQDTCIFKISLYEFYLEEQTYVQSYK